MKGLKETSFLGRIGKFYVDIFKGLFGLLILASIWAFMSQGLPYLLTSLAWVVDQKWLHWAVAIIIGIIYLSVTFRSPENMLKYIKNNWFPILITQGTLYLIFTHVHNEWIAFIIFAGIIMLVNSSYIEGRSKRVK